MNTISISATNPEAVLEVYAEKEHSNIPKPAALIYPGGGYRALSEAERLPIVAFFRENGFQPFVLLYSIGELAHYPAPLLEGSRAVWEIRKNHEEYGIDPTKIILVGFSAGAHAATMLATCWQEDFSREGMDIPFGGNKPNATVTGYTPTTFEDFAEKAKKAGIPENAGPSNLLGKPGTMWAEYSALTTHTKVTENTPPAFLWKTSSDAPGFSTAYAKACKDCGVECELHIFSDRNRCAAPAIYQEKSELGGVYGKNTQLWGTLALNWLNYIFSIPKVNNDKV